MIVWQSTKWKYSILQKSDERLFVDTNILIFSTNELSEWQQPAEKLCMKPGNAESIWSIVATMQVHGVYHLLTHNTADFERFSSFINILPLEQTYKSIAAAWSLPTNS